MRQKSCLLCILNHIQRSYKDKVGQMLMSSNQRYKCKCFTLAVMIVLLPSSALTFTTKYHSWTMVSYYYLIHVSSEHRNKANGSKFQKQAVDLNNQTSKFINTKNFLPIRVIESTKWPFSKLLKQSMAVIYDRTCISDRN